MLPASTTAATACAAAAAMESAAATKAAACSTAESAACRWRRASLCATAVRAHSALSASITTRSATVSWASPAGISTASADITTPSAGITTPSANVSAPSVAVSAATVAATAVPAATVPRAGTQEDSAVEPLRSVITVRSAGVRVISVIAPITYRCRVIHGGLNDGRADPDAYLDLSICHYRERQGQKHRNQNQAQTPHKSS